MSGTSASAEHIANGNSFSDEGERYQPTDEELIIDQRYRDLWDPESFPRTALSHITERTERSRSSSREGVRNEGIAHGGERYSNSAPSSPPSSSSDDEDRRHRRSAPRSPPDGGYSGPASDEESFTTKSIRPPTGRPASKRGKSRTRTMTDTLATPLLNEQVARALAESDHLRIDPARLKHLAGYPVMSGSFGTVRVAKYDDQMVAVKELRIGGDDAERARFSMRFARELKVWARLDHPNLLKLSEFYTDPEMLIAQFVCPFYPLGHIRNYLDVHRPAYDVRLRLAQDTATGLQYLHTLRIVHGDLKELNVLVDPEPRALLCDYGVAPEFLNGSRPDLPNDMWAWGCLFLKIITDISPYQDVAEMACLIKIIHGTPPADVSCLGISATFRTMLDQCWNIDPSLRPSILQCIDIIESSRSKQDLVPPSPKILSVDQPKWKLIPFQKNSSSAFVQQTFSEEVQMRDSAMQEQNLSLSHLAIAESSMTVDIDPPTSLAPPTPKARLQEAAQQISRSQTMDALRELAPTQILTEHHGLVRHLQFSPDGKWLATGSWDQKAIIWKVDRQQLSLHRVLAHPGQGSIDQVAWSPDGCLLLTNTHKLIKIWTARAGVCIKTVNRTYRIEAVTWLPNSEAFACVENGQVHIIDLQAIVQHTHDFPQMEINDVGFTPDAKRMMLVGTLKTSKSKLNLSKARAKTRIVVYNLDDNAIENQVPLLTNARNITVSSGGTHALVSYGGKASHELWRIYLTQDVARLELSSTFMSGTEVEWAGPSYFGGLRDAFVICTGKKGSIHIWDGQYGALLHTLKGTNVVEGIDEDVTSIAWNPDTPGHCMIASATRDGQVKIWTAPAPPETQPSKSSRVSSPASSE